MSQKSRLIWVVAVLGLCIALVGTVAAQSSGPNAPDVSITTKFTHQGQLQRNGVLFDGTCNMRFTLWDAAAAGVQQASYTVPAPVTVSEGVFAVEVDFGAQFKGEARWIQPETQCADDVGYTTLPRVALTAMPYALYSAAPWVTAINSTIYYNSGGVGIGTASPTAGYKLEVNGATQLTPGGSGGNIQFGTPNGETGMTIIGANRADVRFDGTSLKLVAGSGTGPPAPSSGIAINTSGNIGIGTTNPAAKLHVLANGSSIGVYGVSPTGPGVHGESTSGWGVYGKSQSSVGAYGQSTSGWGVYGKSQDSIGVYGESTSYEGVRGTSHNVDHGGVVGINDAPGGIAVYGIAPNGGYAAWFNGRTKTNVVEITGGADLAERFDVSDASAEPGTLMIIDAANPGQLTISTRAYDTKVAGIVSGAGGVKPGLTLHQAGVMDGDTEVAIAGRVYVKAIDSNGPIEPGDLLTTSDRPGYAMKATDRDRAHGAIIGKAMTGLDSGTGLVLVLVNLQ